MTVFTVARDAQLSDFDRNHQEEHISYSILQEIIVLKHLEVLDPSKACDSDDFNPKLLKECAHELSYLRFVIYRKSLEEGKIPDDWKHANVTSMCIKYPNVNLEIIVQCP